MRAVIIPKMTIQELFQRPDEACVLPDGSAMLMAGTEGNIVAIVPPAGTSLMDVPDDELNSMIVNAFT